MMTEDEIRRRSVRDVEQTSARPMPKEINVGELVITVAVILAVGILMFLM